MGGDKGLRTITVQRFPKTSTTNFGILSYANIALVESPTLADLRRVWMSLTGGQTLEALLRKTPLSSCVLLGGLAFQ